MNKPTVISATEMHKQRGELIRRCFRDKEHFIIEKDGVPLVAMIPIELYETLFSELKKTVSSSGNTVSENKSLAYWRKNTR